MIICPHCGKLTDGAYCSWCGTPLPRQTASEVRETDHQEGFRGRISSQEQAAGQGYRRGRGTPGPEGRIGIFSWLGRLLRYMRDPRVQWWKKALVVAAAAYVLIPIDFMPDLVPLFGWADDAVAIGLAWRFLSQELRHYS